MFKFLRKYNKWILAVGGTLLMIVFLGGQALQGLFESAGAGSATVATINGKAVSQSEWRRVQEEFGFLQKGGWPIPYVGKINKPEHWYLLTREAEQAGLIGGTAASMLDAEQLQIFAINFQASPQFVAETIAKVNGVESLIRGYRSAGKISDRRLRHFARDRMSGVQAEMVVIKADAESSTYEPTEAELHEQFEKYKGEEPGAGEMGFGYKLPHRAKLEWLTIPEATVREVVEKGDRFSRVEQLKHWQRFAGQRSLPAFDAAAMSVPDAVKTDLLATLTEETLDSIAKYAHDQVRAKQIGLVEEDGYVTLPADWSSKQMDFLVLAKLIQDRFGIATPTYQSSGEWLDGSAMDEQEGVGTATTKQFGPQVRLSSLAGAAKEFSESPLYPDVQKGIVLPPLRERAGEDGSVYLARMTDTDINREPYTVDEVREQVVRDVRLLKSYDQLLAAQADIEKKAEEQGLLAIAVEHESPVYSPRTVTLCDANLMLQFLQSNMGARAIPTSLPVIGSDEKAIKKILEYASRFPEGTVVANLPEADRVTVVSSQDGLAVVVLRLVKLEPISERTYGQLAGGVAMGLQEMIVSEELPTDEETGVLEAFTLEAMAKRHGFEFSSRGVAEDGAGDEAGDNAVPPADASANASSG